MSEEAEGTKEPKEPTPKSSGAGKGDAPRPVNKKRWDDNYERIFGKKGDTE